MRNGEIYSTDMSFCDGMKTYDALYFGLLIRRGLNPCLTTQRKPKVVV